MNEQDAKQGDKDESIQASVECRKKYKYLIRYKKMSSNL